MRVTADEEAKLQSRADEAGVTVARLLSESALGNAPNPSRRVIISELFVIRRQIQGAATNLNQIAHSANSGVFCSDTESTAALEQWFALVDRMGKIVDEVEAGK
jgi:hypothetical protein